MAFNEQLGNRLREALADAEKVDEKVMFGGLCFMVDDKMCIGVVRDELMCRIDPDLLEDVLEKPGCRMMDMSGKTMKGFVMVDEHGYRKQADFNDWVQLCLDFNPKARSSKKKAAAKQPEKKKPAAKKAAAKKPAAKNPKPD